jgi:hypothetical protein
VVIATILSLPLQTILESGFRKAIKPLVESIEGIFKMGEFVNSFGNVKLCDKPIKSTCLPDPVKEKKKEEPKKEKKEEKKEKKEEKPKDNVESLPPSDFNLYDFKTLFVNHPDKAKEGVDTFYQMLDWKGWSFWFLHYDIYKGEGEKLHITNNLMNGFLSRAEHVNKYTFGRMAVLGEEPDLQIMGCWLMRGLEIPDGLTKEHPQFEYYRTRKLDPQNNSDDDKLVREFFGGKEEDIVNGLKVQTIRWQK